MERERVALAAVQADDVIPERREHRRRDLAGLERVGGFRELRHVSGFRRRAEIAALGARNRVDGLALGDVLELCALRDLVSERLRFRLRGGAVRGCHEAGNHDQGDRSPAHALELVFVRIEVRANVGV